MTDPVHPIPVTGLACSCGAELEVVERGRALDLVCPRGCAYRPPPNLRRRRAPYPPVERICTRCQRPIERREGQQGRPSSMHDECLTPAERAKKQAHAVAMLAQYRARRARAETRRVACG